MPIENEQKYILDVKNPTKFFNYVRHLAGAESYQYKQGYLNDNTRIREIKNDDGTCGEWVFTYKNKINKNLIEIETNISERDFNQLWIKVSKVIQKNRVKVPFNNLIWEIDFITKPGSNDCYLVMVEVEMAEDAIDPGRLPDFVTDNLLYKVLDDDNRFFNTQLTNLRLVEKIIKELKDGKLQST